MYFQLERKYIFKMIKIRISELYLPSDIHIKPCDLLLNIASKTTIHSLKCDIFEELRLEITEDRLFELSLLANNMTISQMQQDFEFLRAESFYEVHDDWISFKLPNASTPSLLSPINLPREKFIRIRISGCKFSEKFPQSINSDESSLVDLIYSPPTTIEPALSGVHSDVFMLENLLEIYSPCPYLNIISNIECQHKSIEWKHKLLKMNEWVNIQNFDRKQVDREIIKVYGNSSVDLNKSIGEEEINSLALAILGLTAREKWAEVERDEIEIIEKVSESMLSGLETLETDSKLINKEYRKEIDEVNEFLNDLDSKRESLIEPLEEMLRGNGKIERENKLLREEYLRILAENREIECVMNCDSDYIRSLEKELGKEMSNREDIEREIGVLKNSYDELIDDHLESQGKLDRETQEIIKKSQDIEREIEELKKENRKINTKILRQTFIEDSGSVENSREVKDVQERNLEFQRAAHSHIKYAETVRLEANIESTSLINKIEKSTKIGTQKQIKLKKSIETANKLIVTQQIELKSIKKIRKVLDNQLSRCCYLENCNFIYNYLKDNLAMEGNYLSDSLFSLYEKSKAILKYQRIAYNLLEINKIQGEFNKTIACSLNPQYIPSHDRIDFALAEFVNLHKAELTSTFSRKSYGIYKYEEKTLKLLLHNKKLVVKSGSGYKSIGDFILLKKQKRASSQIRTSPLHSIMENIDYQHEII